MNKPPRNTDLEQQIDAYVKGHLTDDEAERLWIELLKNPAYIDLLDTELHIKSIIDERNRRTREASSRVGFWNTSWKWAAAAVSLGVLIVALNLLRGARDENRPEALSAISMTEHLAAPDIVRAGAADLSVADSILINGFNAAVSSQMGNALEIYEEVVNNHRDDVHAVSRAYFNIGIIRYNADRYTDAAGAFNRALESAVEDPIIKEKTYWFLAHTYLHLNEFNQAHEALKHVFSLDGIYRDQASRLLDKLDEMPGGKME